MSHTILLIEDNEEMSENITSILKLAHYQVIRAANGKEGVALAQKEHPDLILCDIMMPELDGYGVLHILNGDPETAQIPFIFLTAKAEKSDLRAGMNLGADDYITKPFSPRVLISRVRAVLRRSEREAGPKKHIKIDGLVIDASRHEVFLDGKNVVLTMTEFNLLRYLASRPGRVFTRDQLMSGVLGEDSMVVDRTIDVHVASLRKKLGRYATYIVTVRGLGYKFKD